MPEWTVVPISKLTTIEDSPISQRGQCALAGEIDPVVVIAKPMATID